MTLHSSSLISPGARVDGTPGASDHKFLAPSNKSEPPAPAKPALRLTPGSGLPVFTPGVWRLLGEPAHRAPDWAGHNQSGAAVAMFDRSINNGDVIFWLVLMSGIITLALSFFLT